MFYRFVVASAFVILSFASSVTGKFPSIKLHFIFSITLRPGGGGTPLNGLYRYVPRNRVWFLEVLDP